MKRHLLIIVLLLAICLPMTAQVDPVQPFARKLILAELKQDFRDFNKKVANMKVTKKKKAALAAEYSDLIERMDVACHSPAPKPKVDNRVIAAKKVVTSRIDH